MRATIRRGLQGLALASGLSAGTGLANEAIFDVTLAGVQVAEMVVAGDVADGTYQTQVTINSDGLAGLFKRVRFTAQATGTFDNGFVPAGYTEQADTGRRQSRVEMAYEAGVPRIITYSSPRPDGPDLVDPTTQGGALDPATALYAGLRDVAAAQGCAVAFNVFDGRRSSAYALSGDGLTCTGDYRRIAGYTPEEMAERSRFPIEVVYAAEGEMLRVVEASVQTIYGKVRLKRR